MDQANRTKDVELMAAKGVSALGTLKHTLNPDEGCRLLIQVGRETCVSCVQRPLLLPLDRHDISYTVNSLTRRVKELDEKQW